MTILKTSKVCFVIMPFSGTQQPLITTDQWTAIYEETFAPAIEGTGYLPSRSTIAPGNFVRGIVESLRSADIVLADLTGGRPNVFYELGVRHALKKGSILVAQNLEDIPSDLRSYFVILYGWTTSAERTKFASDFAKALSEVTQSPSRADSPVSDFLEMPWAADAQGFRILPGSTERMGRDPSTGDPVAAGAHVFILNAGAFVPRVRCSLTFFREDGSRIFDRDMPARWSAAPEPLTPLALPEVDGTRLITAPDLSKVPYGAIMDFAPKEQEAVAAAVKFPDGTCWGWTPESYLYGWRHPVWRLPIELLQVRVRVAANGVEYSENFSLDTRVNWDELRVRVQTTGATSDDLALTQGIEIEPSRQPDRTDVAALDV